MEGGKVRGRPGVDVVVGQVGLAVLVRSHEVHVGECWLVGLAGLIWLLYYLCGLSVYLFIIPYSLNIYSRYNVIIMFRIMYSVYLDIS